LPEQTEIAAAVKTINRKLESHREKPKAAQDLFRTLLHELMTAKLRVDGLELGSEMSESG